MRTSIHFSKGMWSGFIILKKHKLLNWKSGYGNLFLQAKVCDSGTYFLLDKDKEVICKITGYVPNGLIPDTDGCGDYIRLRINNDGTIENWPEKPDFSDFTEGADAVEKIDETINETPILDTRVEFTYTQLMAKLLRLPMDCRTMLIFFQRTDCQYDRNFASLKYKQKFLQQAVGS